MPRKKEPTHVTEKYTFPTRLRELMEENMVTQKTLADAIKMRPQTVSLYTTGQSFPDVNTLKKISEFFNVSADYLVGISNVQGLDLNVKSMCEYTGLSEMAVRLLHTVYTNQLHSELDSTMFLFINFMLGNDIFYWMANDITNMKDAGRALMKKKDVSRTWREPDMSDSIGYRAINLFEYTGYLEYKILQDFGSLLHLFTHCETPYEERKEGLPNAIHQENDHKGG